MALILPRWVWVIVWTVIGVSALAILAGMAGLL